MSCVLDVSYPVWGTRGKLSKISNLHILMSGHVCSHYIQNVILFMDIFI